MQKRQDHILWTLESKSIEHQQIDISDPLFEKEREFMRENTKNGNNQATTILPPQIFNDEEYIGVSRPGFVYKLICD
jgi:glutaredoxin